MLFNSLIFLFGFLPMTYVVFWALPGARARYVWLAITGYVFYGYWDPRFCLLMLFSTLVSYGAGRVLLHHAEQGVRRRWAMALPVTVDLLLLGFFKYAGFVATSINDLLAGLGLSPRLPVVDVVLPIGISFYTFHTISYVVDAYRGIVRPTRNFFEFSAYVSLFSQLVAGPIVRFRQIEQDLENLGQAEWRRWLPSGIAFFLFGLLEKVVIADSLAPFVEQPFAHPETLGAFAAWVGALTYTFQLYFDFSGYSTMAVGLGHLFGLRIPQNFNSPYRSPNPSEFWRRWHISLSTCMRDYLYIPLGGNTGGSLAVSRNLMLTMLIGGLWHGANWTFIAWGAYHGLLLLAHRALTRRGLTLPGPLAVGVTFLLVLIGWVFFRATSLSLAGTYLAAMGGAHGLGAVSLSAWQGALLVLGAVGATALPNAFEAFRQYTWKPWHAFAMSLVFGACLAVIAGNDASPFLYFQF